MAFLYDLLKKMFVTEKMKLVTTLALNKTCTEQSRKKKYDTRRKLNKSKLMNMTPNPMDYTVLGSPWALLHVVL